MKIGNRILAGLLSFTAVFGELLPVYAEGTDTEYAADDAAVSGEAGDFVFVPGYVDLPEDQDVTTLHTDKSYHELRNELTAGAEEAEYHYSAEADRAVAADRAFPYACTEEASITEYFATFFPPVRNQNPFGSCWAHSAMSLGEFYLATHGKLTDRTAVDFSELHMAWFCNTQGTPSLAGDTGDKVSFSRSSVNEILNGGGNLKFAAQTLVQNRGFADESVAAYPQYDSSLDYRNTPVNTPDPSTERQNSAWLRCSYQISMEDREQVKQAVISNGMTGISIYWDDRYYNSGTNSYICTNRTNTNHAVCIVGWDDDYPASAFGGKATGNGAWLIRNSWNYYGEMDSLSQYCYFWLSYEDTSISRIAWVFEADTESYDHHYFYDSEPHGESLLTYDEGKDCYSANVYQARGNAEGSELLEAVGFSMIGIDPAGSDYEVCIYTGLEEGGDPSTGELREGSITRGTVYFNGYYTIELKEAVPLEEGEYYAVVLKREDGCTATVEYSTYMNNGFSAAPGSDYGQSFFAASPEQWNDNKTAGYCNFVLGAYTSDVNGAVDKSGIRLTTSVLELKAGESETITATVTDSEGKPDSEAEVMFTSSDSSVATVTSEGRNASITARKSGTATITAECGRLKAKCRVKVLPSPMDPVPRPSERHEFYLVKGQKLDLTSQGRPEIFDRSTAVTLSKKGIITAKKEGKAIIRAGLENYDIFVVEPALSQTLVKMIPGEKERLQLARNCGTQDMAEQFPVCWFSSAPEVVNVNSDGEISAVSKGSATVTAYVNGKAYICKVKVSDVRKPEPVLAASGEAISFSALMLQPLQSYTLKQNGISFKKRAWYSEDGELKQEMEGKKSFYDNGIIRIDEKGKITAVGSGSCTVCFKDESGVEYRLPLTVAEPVERELYLNCGKSRKLKFYGVRNADAHFSSDDRGVAVVDAKGKVSALSAGETTVSCVFGNFTFVTHVHAESAALVTDDALVPDGDVSRYLLRIRKGSEPYSLRFRRDDSCGVYQPVLFKSNKSEIAFVDENGRIEARNSGNARITAKVNGKKITIRVSVIP